MLQVKANSVKSPHISMHKIQHPTIRHFSIAARKPVAPPTQAVRSIVAGHQNRPMRWKLASRGFNASRARNGSTFCAVSAVASRAGAKASRTCPEADFTRSSVAPSLTLKPMPAGGSICATTRWRRPLRPHSRLRRAYRPRAAKGPKGRCEAATPRAQGAGSARLRTY